MKYLVAPAIMVLLLLLGSLWEGSDLHSSVNLAQADDSEFYVNPYYDGVVVDDLDPAATQTHFNGISKSLSDLDFPQRNKDKISAEVVSLSSEELLNLLNATVRPLVQQNVPPESIERIRYLLVKSLPDQRGVELANALPGYLCYSREKDALEKRFDNQKNNLFSQRQNYKQQISVREKCMGKAVSDDLFKESDRLTWYLFDRWEIMSDDTLTERQKKGKLNELMNQFTQTSRQEPDSEY